jgi:hypothetical protein
MQDIGAGSNSPAAEILRRRFVAAFEARTRRLVEECRDNPEGAECRHVKEEETPVLGRYLATTGALAALTGVLCTSSVARVSKVPRIAGVGLGVAAALSTFPWFTDLSYLKEPYMEQLMKLERSVYCDCMCEPLLEVEDEGDWPEDAGESSLEREAPFGGDARGLGADGGFHGLPQPQKRQEGGLRSLFERYGSQPPPAILERLRQCKERRARMEEMMWKHAADGEQGDGAADAQWRDGWTRDC